MKKVLCLVLALMVLALCPAMAETAVQTLVAPDGSYSFNVPEGYIPVNAEAMLALFAEEEMQQMIAESMGLEDASQLAMYFEALDANNVVMVLSDDLVGNLNVQQAESSLTMQQVIMLKSMMDEVMVQQYATLGITEDNIQMMDIQQIGGRSWYGIVVYSAGIRVQTMMTVENGVQYTFAFTDIDPQMAQTILASFTVNKAE